jgi:hypothetical protein
MPPPAGLSDDPGWPKREVDGEMAMSTKWALLKTIQQEAAGVEKHRRPEGIRP